MTPLRLRRLLLAGIVALALFVPGPGARARQAAAGPSVSAASLAGKPLAVAQKALGRPRKIDGAERYHRVEGFVRVVVTEGPDGTVAGLTFQFPDGKVANEAAARRRVGIGPGHPPLPSGWSVAWYTEEDSGHDDLVLSAPAPAPVEPTEAYVLTHHFRQRLRERGISEETARDVLKHGRRFYDPKFDGEVRWKDGVYIALTRGGVLKTVVRGDISPRWRPL